MDILFDYQYDAVKRIRNGSILCGGVGSGKSRTSLAYYYLQCGGNLEDIDILKNKIPLYIITTARKRDSLEWEGELINFYLDKKEVVIDSWNNIKKYVNVEHAFFIFDEQRVVGSGSWVNSFFKITKKNQWILLSATPGDTWSDYAPVFIANGYFKNFTEFRNRHVVYNRFVSYPKIDRYLDTRRLLRLRDSILVNMNYKHDIEKRNIDIYTDYDRLLYKSLGEKRWNFEKDEPIRNASELCYMWRKVCNMDISRAEAVRKIANENHKIIVFYNFDYELDILKSIAYAEGTEVAEWNGHKHQPVPVNSKRWVYLVQYNSGNEAWNCIDTNVIVFYSMNYSYKIMVQAMGRIDRLNTPFSTLIYYHLKTHSNIDLAISKALKNKKKFNESKFVNF